MIAGFLGELGFYLNKGGPVMWVLFGLALVLWYTLGLRIFILRRWIIDTGTARADEVARAAPPNLARALDDTLWDLRTEMGSGAAVVRVIVAVAPLLGLLGTVSGMIETFDSLAGMELHSSSGGVAGGISEALFTTQMGLAVSVPGLVVGRILDGKQRRMNQELDQVREGVLELARREAA